MSKSHLELVHYLAQHPAITPRVVFHRLRIMGVLFGIGVVGTVAAMAVIGFDIAQSEPARLLGAFGFIAGLVVVVATICSAVLLLWGGYVSEYVAKLDARGDAMDARGVDESDVGYGEVVAVAAAPLNVGRAAGVSVEAAAAAPEVVVQATRDMVDSVNAEIGAVVEAFAQAAISHGESQRARDLQKELSEMREMLRSMEAEFSIGQRQEVYMTLQSVDLGFRGGQKMSSLTAEKMRQLVAQYDEAMGQVVGQAASPGVGHAVDQGS